MSLGRLHRGRCVNIQRGVQLRKAAALFPQFFFLGEGYILVYRSVLLLDDEGAKLRLQYLDA